MRHGNAVVGFLVFAFGSTEALAQGQGRRETKSPPLNLQHAQLGTHGFGEAARAKMRNGDFEGALDLFDEALRTSTEPVLYRDRGLCHEKLGHPYPAIDDYRRYLTSAPDAPDADTFRERLDLLQEKVSGHGRAAEADDSPFMHDAKAPSGGSAANGGGASASGGANGGGASASGATNGGGASANAGANANVTMGAEASASPPADTADDEEDDAARGPLRRGKGWSLAPFLAVHKWFIRGTSFGDNQTWSECVGLQVRYAPNKNGALLLEAGYEHFNATNLDVAVVYGLTTMVGYEFRFPLDPAYDNQFFLTPGIGYEQLQIAPTDPNVASASEGALTGRVRFGYRRLFGKGTAFEASLDGGGADFFLFDGSGKSTGTAFAGLNLAVAWGL
jgi:tetratricopeptide (TPR) repeat protein